MIRLRLMPRTACAAALNAGSVRNREGLVACAQPAIGLDEVKALLPPDRTVLDTVEVRHQAVVKGVHGEADIAPDQFGQRETQHVDVHCIVSGAHTLRWRSCRW